MKERLFRFKQFSVAHELSAMKVGVDGVLLGAWNSAAGRYVLDAGTGCGLIALMTAQRNPLAIITGIDIDQPSVTEASHNFECSPWSARLEAKCIPYELICRSSDYEGKFQMIVSNPPYFDSGIANPSTPRETARHQGGLSPITLARLSHRLLDDCGILSMILPAELSGKAIEEGIANGLSLYRRCHVRDNGNRPYKRTMIEMAKSPGIDRPLEEELTLFGADGLPTEAHRTLCKEFYLRF